MADARDVQLLVIGGGPGGYPAALHAADHGLKTLLVDADPKLGGVCLNRGCIPSKALLHAAKVVKEAKHAADIGLSFGEPKLDLAKLRDFVQTKVIGKLTGGIAQLCKARQADTLRGHASFESPNSVVVKGEGGAETRVTFQHCIIATGSVPAVPKMFQLGDDRIMDSTAALLLPDVPKRLLVIGGGYIGLEIGSIYAALGTKVTVVEFTDGLLPLADRDLVAPLEKVLRADFEAIYLNTKVAALKPQADGVVAVLEGKDVPGELLFDRPNPLNLADPVTAAVVDPGYVSTVAGVSVRNGNLLPANTVPGAGTLTTNSWAYVAKNAAYTYPDRNNALVGLADPTTGRVVVPSAHRPALFFSAATANNWFGNLTTPAASNPNFNANWLTPAGRLKLLRPRRIDHLTAAERSTLRTAGLWPVPVNPTAAQLDQLAAALGDGPTGVGKFPYPTANPDGSVTGDVQNSKFAAGVQRNDSVWLDAGLPTQDYKGKRLAPLVAITLLPLDGRVNLTAAGNLKGTGPPPSTPATWGSARSRSTRTRC